MDIWGALRILGLSFATEALYTVPYQLPGIYRPIFLKVFDLTNEEVGVVQSTYGMVNLLTYLPGGYLADRAQPRILMPCALLLSAACSMCLLKADTFNFKVAGLSLIWAMFAISGNLLYWSPLVASVREVGGARPGLAFGLEQCCRGLIAALMSTALLVFLGRATSEGQEDLNETGAQYHSIVAAFTCILLLATMVLLVVAPARRLANDAEAMEVAPSSSTPDSSSHSSPLSRHGCSSSVWLMALVVLAAYTGNLATGFFAGLAHDVYGMSNVEAGAIGTIAFVLRAVAPCLAGVAADRCGRTKTASCLFAGLVSSYVWLAAMPMEAAFRFWLPVQAACASAFAFGLASVYFTLLDEFGLPQEETGAVVGMVSAIGYLPDIFVTPMAGYFLDNYGGQQGYRMFMLSVASIGVVGLLATSLIANVRRGHHGVPDSESDSSASGKWVTCYGNCYGAAQERST